MAELLGTISSAFAVAEVAIRAGSTVSKLRSLWEQVKDVPDTIRDLITEIEILDPVVSDMERDFLDGAVSLSPMLFNDTGARLSAGYCQAAVQDLRALIEDLAADIEDSRRRKRISAKLKVVLKKETLERMQKRLERAVRLLNSAQLNYLTTLTKLQPTIIVSKLQSSQTSQQRRLLEDQTEVAHREDKVADEGVERRASAQQPRGSHTRQLALPFVQPSSWGRVIAMFASEEDSHTHGVKPVFAGRLQLPSWLSTTAWDLHLGKSYSGWQLSLRPKGIIPDDALAIQYAKEGNYLGLRDLFCQGLASPTDCSRYGKSLLQYAAETEEFDTVLELLNHNAGVELRAVNDAADWVIWSLGFASWGSTLQRSLDGLSLYQDLTSRGFFDSTENCADEWRDSEGNHAGVWLVQASPNLDLFLNLLKHCSPSQYSLPVWKRAQPLTYTHHIYCWRLDALRRLINPKGTIQANDLRLSLEGGCSIFHLTAFHWGAAMSLDNDDPTPWLGTMKEMLSMVDDLHSRESMSILHLDDEQLDAEWVAYRRTALFWFLLGVSHYLAARTMKHWSKRVNQALLLWLKALEESQISLKEYGRREFDLLMADDQARSTRWVSSITWLELFGYVATLPMLAGFRYGDRVEDWVLEWHIAAEELAGEFWEMVESGEVGEKPILNIPGSWMEDED